MLSRFGLGGLGSFSATWRVFVEEGMRCHDMWGGGPPLHRTPECARLLLEQELPWLPTGGTEIALASRQEIPEWR